MEFLTTFLCFGWFVHIQNVLRGATQGRVVTISAISLLAGSLLIVPAWWQIIHPVPVTEVTEDYVAPLLSNAARVALLLSWLTGIAGLILALLDMLPKNEKKSTDRAEDSSRRD